MLADRWLQDRSQNCSLTHLTIDATICGPPQDGYDVCLGDPCGKCAMLHVVLHHLAYMLSDSSVDLHLVIAGELLPSAGPPTARNLLQMHMLRSGQHSVPLRA